MRYLAGLDILGKDLRAPVNPSVVPVGPLANHERCCGKSARHSRSTASRRTLHVLFAGVLVMKRLVLDITIAVINHEPEDRDQRLL